jgi:hypothetical protein
MQMSRRFAPEGDFGAVHAVDARVAAGRGEAHLDAMAGQKSEDHQVAGFLFREVDSLQDRLGAAG